MDHSELIEYRARLLSAMACSSRLRVLMLLAEGEAKVGDIATTLGLSDSATSQHLSRLRESGLVKAERQGQTVHYGIKSEVVRPVLRLLERVVRPSTPKIR